jgi:hypothetical protein
MVRVINPLWFLLLSATGVVVGLSGVPEIVPLCAFLVAFANGSMYDQLTLTHTHTLSLTLSLTRCGILTVHGLILMAMMISYVQSTMVIKSMIVERVCHDTSRELHAIEYRF